MFKRFVFLSVLFALLMTTCGNSPAQADEPDERDAFIIMCGTGDWVGPDGCFSEEDVVFLTESHREYERYFVDYLRVYVPENEDRPYYDLEIEAMGGFNFGSAVRFPFNRERQGEHGFSLSQTARGNNWLTAFFGVFDFQSLTISPLFVKISEIKLIVFVQQGKPYNTPGPERFHFWDPFTVGVILIH